MASLNNLSKRLDRLQRQLQQKDEHTIMVSDASIKTATIEVRVMKIGNRQVTLAVFRQLPEKPIIDHKTGMLCGTPWGRVNYHVDCGTEKPHLHVVWQEGNNLYRALARPSSSYRGVHSDRWKQVDYSMGEYEKAYIATRILEGWIPDYTPPKLPSLPDPYILTLFDRSVMIYLPDEVRGAWTSWMDGTIHLYQEEKLRKIVYRILNNQTMGSQKIADHFWLPLAIEREELEKREEQVLQSWQQSYSQLEQLDQLFIAV